MVDALVLSALRDGNSSKEFEEAANRNASSFWIWIITGAGFYFWLPGWWVTFPVLLGTWRASNSVMSTLVARRLKELGV